MLSALARKGVPWGVARLSTRRAAVDALTHPPSPPILVAVCEQMCSGQDYVAGAGHRKDSLGRRTRRETSPPGVSCPPQPPSLSPFPEALDARLKDVLRRRGIERLYSHQAEAVEAVLAGRNVVVVTPTASGKTLCYNLPVLQTLLGDPEARALYLFPTKALAQDQLDELHGLVERPRRRHQDLHLRRRHARRRPALRARRRPHRRHQPRHAAHRHPAASHEVAEAVREPALRRHRRAAPVPRRLRQPRRQRHPPSAAASAASTAPTPSSSAARRPSPTRASWRSGSSARPSPSSTAAARRGRRRPSPSTTRPSSTASWASGAPP